MVSFEEVLDQAIDMLRRRGRVTYRALKRQFDLDEDYLTDLKDELTEVQQIAVDHEGRILVLTGESARSPAPIAQPDLLWSKNPNALLC